jgi:hypothetical protein
MVKPLGHVDEAAQAWLVLACDEHAEQKVREEAAWDLQRRNRSEAAQAWLALARDDKVWIKTRMEATDHLGFPERPDYLLTLMRDEKVDEWVRIEAAEVLCRMGVWIKQHEDQPPVSLWGIAALSQMGCQDEVVAKLRMWVLNAGMDTKRVGEKAIHVLKYLKCSGELRALMCDEAVSVRLCVNAAEALGELEHVDEAAPILTAIACDEKADVSIRIQASRALEQLQCTNEAARAWLALARDDRNGWWQLETVQALGRLSRGDEAVPILMAMLHDREWEQERIWIIRLLGEFGDARTLDDLEHIAANKRWWNWGIDREAQQAIAQIRERMEHKDNTQTTLLPED